MRKFDYSFLNNAMLPVNLINLTSSIASLKTMAGVRKQEYAKIFTELKFSQDFVKHKFSPFSI